MSLETNVARAIIDLGEIIKSEVISSVAKVNADKNMEISREDLSVLAGVIGSTIEATILNRVDVVTRLVK